MMADEPNVKKRKLSEDENESPVTENPEAVRQEIETLLRPFSREQVVELLVSSAMQHSALLEEIKSVASADLSHRKLFVRGLAWETTSETVNEIFSAYGEIEEAAVIKDKHSGKSKGFAFVTYRDMYGAQEALKNPTKSIDGRDTTCNLAAMRPGGTDYVASMNDSQGTTGPVSQRKLFVRGLSWDTTDDSLRVYFEQFGKLEEAAVARDKKTGKSKGFGFITFCEVPPARLALQQPQKMLDGRRIYCNLAVLGNPAHQHGKMGMAPGVAQVMPTVVNGMPAYVTVPQAGAQMAMYAPPAVASYGQNPAAGQIRDGGKLADGQQSYAYGQTAQYQQVGAYGGQPQYAQASYGRTDQYSQYQQAYGQPQYSQSYGQQADQRHQ